MSSELFYRTIPNYSKISDRELISFFVYYLTIQLGSESALLSAIRNCFLECDLPVPARLSQYLSEGVAKKQSRYVKAKNGYRLHKHFADKVAQELGNQEADRQVSKVLRNLESELPEGHTRTFLNEAIICFESNANRAAIIMTWVLSMNLLMNHIITSRLADFNAALALAPANKTRSVANYDELAELKESKIIELAKSAGIISKDVWRIMDQALGTRNSCAHPAELTVAKSKCISVIEDLFANVISKF